jgi:uncharacterized membrane protein YphA (DoxX/SURF4 family)
MMKPEVILLVRLLVLAFMCILFLQSGLDKVFNYRNNYDWLKVYFAKSMFNGQAKLLLPVLTVLEVAAGIICLIAIFNARNTANTEGLYGLFLCAVTLLSLFAGQRIAKDYAGAANIPGYFLVCILGLLTYLI